MPESCHYLTALHALSHPCLVSLLFIPSLYSTFFNSKNFLFTCLLSFFSCFGCKRTQHRQVTRINNSYKFLLPEAVCCCLKTCNVYITKLAMGYMSTPSFIILGS